MKLNEIVKDINLLKQKSLPVENFLEADNIIFQLEQTLQEISGIGLSAPQIGILKQIAIVRYKDDKIDAKINIINPVDICYNEQYFISNMEGCLSFPGIRLNIKRSKDIEFLANFGKEAHYYSIHKDGELITTAVQHEIDHLFGKVITDYKSVPKISEKKFGPNEPCFCGSGKKYKKCCG